MKIIDFILCDDIRHERGNKISIMGAYNDKIEFQPMEGQEIKWPVNIRLGAYVRLLPEENENFDEIEISIKLTDKEIINLKANRKGQNEGKNPIVLSFVAPNLGLEGPGIVDIEISLLMKQKIFKVIRPDFNFTVIVKNLSVR